MKLRIFLLAFLFVVLNSCKSPMIAEFRESIIQKERVAFHIILGKDGTGNKKLNFLANGDLKGASAAINQQATEFDKLIESIELLSTDGIPEGETLQIAAIDYYRALKDLHFFERKEIEQQELIGQSNDKDLKLAQDQLIELAKQKKSLYEKVYEKEHLLSLALDQFDKANGL